MNVKIPSRYFKYRTPLITACLNQIMKDFKNAKDELRSQYDEKKIVEVSNLAASLQEVRTTSDDYYFLLIISIVISSRILDLLSKLLIAYSLKGIRPSTIMWASWLCYAGM